ncbi:Copper chaperone for superoxide dismutase [Paragonimus heterotremus]|uniref:Copper chaperone for superoxide dismutase n=1 Tax=Paragonimus heterotremus TaxID=100268 RepID=A0A8J4WLM7_9TREM|nr:Copper chaperone for superoxide dismutase [Paragonimus heterotremus]
MFFEIAVNFAGAVPHQNLATLLEDMPEIKSFQLNEKEEFILVETALPVSTLLQKIREAGYPALFRGASSDSKSMQNCDFGSGVATILKREIVCGVCRLFQPSEETLIVDVSVDNLPPERHITLAVHVLGDLSGAAESCGDVFVNHQGCSGKLGSFLSDSNGRGMLVTENTDIKLWEVIGRSVVLHDEDSQTRIACGVIGRSATLRSNTKKVCACSGQTMWEEHAANPIG